VSPHDLYRHYDEPFICQKPGNLGVLRQRLDEEEATVGSGLLRDATLRAIVKHAERSGKDINTAATFLLSKGELP
jgi:hypothetical protein